MRLKKVDLAKALGISPSMMSRYARQGCPTNSIQAALAWRDSTIDPALRKGARLQAEAAPAQQRREQAQALAAIGDTRAEIHSILGQLHAASAGDGLGAQHLALVTRATELAGQQRGLIPLAREALRLVPARLRGAVLVDQAFVDRVLGPLMAALDLAERQPEPTEAEADAATLDRVLYAWAAGERVELP